MITQEKIAYSADDIKSMIKTCKKYNKALEKARELMDKGYDVLMPEIFPDLKESEDEKIKREIVAYINELADLKNEKIPTKWLDWLEKQGEQKHFSDFKAKDWYVSKVDGKIHNMTYNPTDKVEPKFKVGDWITDGHLTCKVLSVTGKSYELHLHNDDYCHFETDVQSVDKRYHLWTIEDAKDGDVLASEDKDKIFLYNGKLDLRGRACAYCGIYKTYDGLRFAKCTVGNYFTYKEPYPTTKEQRDLLFQKITEAGYEWDSEKKELKKIEPKNPIVNVPPRELILSIWDLGNEWKELTNGSISTEYGTQLEYIQKHWQESSYYDNIGDNIPTLTDKDYDKLFINCKH